MRKSFPERHFFPLIILVLAAIFLLDIRVPRGYNLGVLYLFPLLLSWIPSAPRPKLVMLLIFPLLFLAGFFKPPLLSLPVFLVNRATITFVLSLVTFLLEQRKKAERDLRDKEGMLEKRALDAEEGRRILEALMENVPGGIAIADAPDGKVKMISKYCLQILGESEKDVIGQPFEKSVELLQVFYPDNSPVPAGGFALTSAIRSGKLTIGQELRVKMASGEMMSVLVNAAPIRDSTGRITAAVMVWSDISKLKQAEDVLRRDKETFERLVMERTKELISAQLELEHSKRLSDIGSLAATVAHELRNPLGVIRAASYNIKRKAKDAPIANQLANIEKKISQSDQIINNLLFYARLKKPQFEPVKVYHVLQESLDSFRRRFTDFTLSEDLDRIKGLLIDADPVQISEMFNNIISNAHDAVREMKGNISVSGRRLDSSVELVFEDNGTGIKAEELKRVFEPFYTTKARGTGLGLTVSRQIIGLHNGTIEVKSEEGKGTTVAVTLPIKQLQPER